MNAKTLVLLAFAIYGVICWRWYVCGIKQQCGDTVQATAGPVVETPATEDEGAAISDTSFRPYEPDPGAAPPATQPVNDEPDISKVYVEELADQVVIHFPYNSTRKEDNAAIDEYLSRLAGQLTASGGTVTLSGHTDNVGDTKTNEAFALRRAKNIRDILIAKGVKKNQIITKSYGERKPVATNDNPRGRYKNRRVEIKVK